MTARTPRTPANPCPRCGSLAVGWEGLTEPTHWVCGMCRLSFIWLTRDYRAFVDDEDYERVAAIKWCAVKSRDRMYAHAFRVEGHVCIRMHRFILRCAEDIDHQDRNGLNNQKSNFRPANDSQNQANRHKSIGTSSRFKGVTRSRNKKWQAYITANQKFIYLGVFAEEADAAMAYNLAAVEHFGEFARLNVA